MKSGGEVEIWWGRGCPCVSVIPLRIDIAYIRRNEKRRSGLAPQRPSAKLNLSLQTQFR